MRGNIELETKLRRIIYVSRKNSVTRQDVSDIITVSSASNLSEGITGCLLSGQNSFLQILEGPKKAIQDLYEIIVKDSRHTDIKKLCDEAIKERLFSQWSMKSDNFDKIEWSRSELNSGYFLNISDNDAKNIFKRISEQGDSSF